MHVEYKYISIYNYKLSPAALGGKLKNLKQKLSYLYWNSIISRRHEFCQTTKHATL